MLDLLMNIFDVEQILHQGMDVAIYFFMGLAGLVLFVLRLGISLVLGDVGGDFDVDGDIDIEHAGDFSIFSTLSILAFFTGLGWTGVLCRVDLGLGHIASALVAAAVGFGFMFFSAGMMFFVRKLNHQVQYKPEDAIGKTATVYLTIPKRGEGTGQVQVTVSGRRKVMNAVSTRDPIKPFTEVIVKGAQDDETLEVEPKYAEAENESQS